MKYVVLYQFQEKATWELDYVFKVLLRDIVDDCSIEFITIEALLNYDKMEVFQRTILVFFSSLITFEQLKPIVLRIKPKVTIHLSDEFGTRPEFQQLADIINESGIVLRQHNFACYPQRSNIYQIPLGIMTGFPLSLPHVNIHDRDLVWSFIGCMRSERHEMLQLFTQHFEQKKYFLCTTGKMHVKDMAQIYNRSKFVLNGRGCIRLDCFRLYEAVFAGAIPIVMGSKEELEETFLFEGKDDYPPFLFVTTWMEAVSTCKKLLDHPIKLLNLQTNNINWLYTHLDLARKRIVKALQ